MVITPEIQILVHYVQISTTSCNMGPVVLSCPPCEKPVQILLMPTGGIDIFVKSSPYILIRHI